MEAFVFAVFDFVADDAPEAVLPVLPVEGLSADALPVAVPPEVVLAGDVLAGGFATFLTASWEPAALDVPEAASEAPGAALGVPEGALEEPAFFLGSFAMSGDVLRDESGERTAAAGGAAATERRGAS